MVKRVASLRAATLCVLVSVLVSSRSTADVPFIRGDADESGTVTVVDAIKILRALFFGEQGALGCDDAADVDDSGGLEISDVVSLLGFLFQHAHPPQAPFPGCGEDATSDPFSCAGFAACSVDFAGLPLDGNALFFVIDRSGTMQNSGELSYAKREVSRVIQALPSGFEFGVVFFDAGVIRFPQSAIPLIATSDNKASGVAFVQGVPGGGGSCVQAGLLSTLTMAKAATRSRRVIVYVGDGGGSCQGAWEGVYLEQTLQAVAQNNTVGVVIHTVGVYEILHEDFLRRLASENGGIFVRIER